ncbi:unnamed protein product [Dovyalis caffra]|uniref:Pentatricopeptide repeat-containing protein n=1 Tax=Dovyalis caffra TaxID=77055 RepID=A0AAV1SP20_9ROSI|nr:unnamed protein product [Dovyalis caffra]
MGKIPRSLRSAIPSTSFIKKAPSIPTEIPNPQQQQQPHYFPKKPSKRNSQLSKKPQETQTPQPHRSPFKTPSLNEAKKLFNSFISTTKSLQMDGLRLHNSFLKSYTSISTLDDSISLLNHMIKSLPSLSPDRSTYHVLLSQSCKEPDSSLSSAQKVLNLMVNNGFEPNQVTVDVAVRSLCSVGKVEDAVLLVKEFSSKHSKPDTFTYNFLVKCLCKSRILNNVYSFIDEMKNSFDINPDLVTYTILIDNVCNAKNIREADRLVGVLKECGLKPDAFVYNTIMKGYCMLNKGIEAVRIYKQMKEEGVEPDLVTYNTLIFGLSKCGRVIEAKKFLKVMVESGQFPDAVTYTSLMNGMCREGDVLGAMALLGEMELEGCSPNSCTYNTLLHGFCKGRMLNKGIELYELMKKGGMQLEAASYATFVRALCREGRVAEAYEVFDYAVESKSLTDVAAYTTLESTLKWLKKAREQGLAVYCWWEISTRFHWPTKKHQTEYKPLMATNGGFGETRRAMAA